MRSWTRPASLLTIGLDQGEAIQRGGDWFGRPVNLASRVSDRARPGSVRVTEPVKDAAGEEDYRYSFAATASSRAWTAR